GRGGAWRGGVGWGGGVVATGGGGAVDGGPCLLRPIIGNQATNFRCFEQPIPDFLLLEGAAGDQLEQINSIERTVARARLCGSDVLAFTIECCLRVGASLFRFCERDQPGRCQSGILRPPGFPLVHPASSVPPRRPYDIAAAPTHIDAGTDLACAVADIDVGVRSPNQVSTAARGDGRPSGRE